MKGALRRPLERYGVRRIVAALATALLVAGVAGCSEKPPEPAPLAEPEPTSSSPTAPTEPTADPGAAPSLPAEARGTSKAAAVAFVEHWVETLNHATRTGSTDALASLGSRTCSTCEAIADSIDTVSAAGGWLRGDGWRTEEIQYLARQPRKRPTLRVVIDIAPQRVTESRGAEVQRFEGGRVLYTFGLRHQSESWLVEKLERAT